jgi:DNA methyltransferase 1-associated protein 1
MASANDVRDILSLPSRRAEKQPEGSQGAANTVTKTAKASKPKAEGISRELFALLGDNAPSLAIAQSIRAGEQASKFKPKFKRKEARTKRW